MDALTRSRFTGPDQGHTTGESRGSDGVHRKKCRSRMDGLYAVEQPKRKLGDAWGFDSYGLEQEAARWERRMGNWKLVLFPGGAAKRAICRSVSYYAAVAAFCGYSMDKAFEDVELGRLPASPLDMCSDLPDVRTWDGWAADAEKITLGARRIAATVKKRARQAGPRHRHSASCAPDARPRRAAQDRARRRKRAELAGTWPPPPRT